MNLTSTEFKILQEVAKTAAIKAGSYIQSQFDKHYIKKVKEGGDSLASQVVTEVDLKAQEIILSHLQKTIATYDLGLLTEESVDDQSRTKKDYFWCIDPMDGTLPFTERRTGYSVSIALISNAGDPIIGVVYIPDIEACYSAIKGNGVLLNDKPFDRNDTETDTSLHFYMDLSFQSEEHFDFVKFKMKELIGQKEITEIQHHADFGGVRNAVSVMSSNKSCYFKFSKKRNGGGSIWDYASTRLFFEELGLNVTNSAGSTLHLNNPQTTFMNDQGIVYTTDAALSQFIIEMGRQVSEC
ncbi:MAG: inositol monophosphatase family protein [Cyclobacteriaceae bacterium]